MPGRYKIDWQNARILTIQKELRAKVAEALSCHTLP